jgi:hypothetical protein
VADRRDHWNDIYASVDPEAVSWYEPVPAVSLRLIRSVASPSSSVVDVGAGESTLVDQLLADGFEDTTLVDISSTALHAVRRRLGDAAKKVRFVESDVLVWQVDRAFDLWHDRAVFHFLTSTDEREQYVRLTSEAVTEHGAIVLATFAEDGPDHCSGLRVERYSAAALAGLFPSFELAHAERIEHITPSASVQPFTYVVLQR